MEFKFTLSLCYSKLNKECGGIKHNNTNSSESSSNVKYQVCGGLCEGVCTAGRVLL